MMEEQMRKIERAVKIDKSRIFNMQLPPVIDDRNCKKKSAGTRERSMPI